MYCIAVIAGRPNWPTSPLSIVQVIQSLLLTESVLFSLIGAMLFPSSNLFFFCGGSVDLWTLVLGLHVTGLSAISRLSISRSDDRGRDTILLITIRLNCLEESSFFLTSTGLKYFMLSKFVLEVN